MQGGAGSSLRQEMDPARDARLFFFIFASCCEKLRLAFFC